MAWSIALRGFFPFWRYAWMNVCSWWWSWLSLEKSWSLSHDFDFFDLVTFTASRLTNLLLTWFPFSSFLFSRLLNEKVERQIILMQTDSYFHFETLNLLLLRHIYLKNAKIIFTVLVKERMGSVLTLVDWLWRLSFICRDMMKQLDIYQESLTLDF